MLYYSKLSNRQYETIKLLLISIWKSKVLLAINCQFVFWSSVNFFASGNVVRFSRWLAAHTVTVLHSWSVLTVLHVESRQHLSVFCCTDESCISARFSDSLPSFSIDAFNVARFVVTCTSESKTVNKIKSSDKYHSCPANLREVASPKSRSGNNCSCLRSFRSFQAALEATGTRNQNLM